MVRLGLTPEVNALAVLLIVATVALAALYEVKRRRERAREEALREQARRVDEEMMRRAALGVRPTAATVEAAADA